MDENNQNHGNGFDSGSNSFEWTDPTGDAGRSAENTAGGAVSAENGTQDNGVINEVSGQENQDTAETGAGNADGTSGEAPVDYSIATGASESIPRVTVSAGTYGSSAADSYGNGADAAGGFTQDAAQGQTEAGGGDAGSEAQADGINAGGTPYQQGFSPIPEEPVKHKKKLSPKGRKVLAIVLVIVLCGCAGFGGGAIAVKSFGGNTTSAQKITIDSQTDSLDAASAIAEKVMPSVVGITTTAQTTTETIFGLQQGTSTGVGTGIIVDEDGYILTNAHVVESSSNSASVSVDLYDGSTYDGKVLWSDSSLDLAIVKIDASGLTAADLGDSDSVKIGDYAVAIGNPLGLKLERSVTQGIISGLDRSITTTDGSSTNQMEGLIQTDASINAGNSGGPLINSSGQVIGINTAKASSSEGLGFAIPINTALPIIEQIKETGTYESSYIGISGIDLSTVISSYKTDFKATEGVYVNQIYTDSPASKAGLKEGDIITAVDSTDVTDMSSLKQALVKYKPGDTVTLTIERDKATQKVDVTLGSSSDAATTLQGSGALNSSSGTSGSSGSSGTDGSSGANGSSGSGSSGSSGFGSFGSGSDIFGGIFGN